MKRITATLITILVLALSASSLFAQQKKQDKSGGQEAEPPVMFESVDVNVINIDVVVTDRRGNPVHGLTRDDFVIEENGEPQKITNFYEVRGRQILTADQKTQPAPAAEEPAPTLRRKIIFFIDNLSMAPFNRNRVFKAMKQFVEETMQPGDEAMIATWNRSLNIRLPFNANPEQIIQTLDVIAGESALGLQRESDRRTVRSQIKGAQSYTEAIAVARQYAQEMEHDLRTTVSGIDSLMSMVGGVEGRKVMVISSEGFDMQPGIDMFYYLDDIAPQQFGSSSGSGMLEGMGFDAGYLLQGVAHEANAHGITLYTIHAGGLQGNASNSADQSEAVSFQVQQAALNNSTDALQLLADMTGGAATVGTNNFRGGFQKIEHDLDSYYSLGYRAGTERVDRRRSIQVTTKKRGLTLRYRHSFVEQSIGTEMTNRVIANLFHPSETNDLGVFMTTGIPVSAGDGTFHVSVDIHIPMDKLTILPQEDSYRGSFSVWVVAADPNTDMSDVTRKDNTVSLTKDQYDAIKDRSYVYSVDLLLREGRNTISVGVIDQLGKLRGFVRQDVLAKDLR